jgi:hypothetical protein
MAQVFTNDMVAHVWAQQTQDSGRSNNGQFFFTGRALWSYGSHFCVGFIIPADASAGRPGPVALLESGSYSITTSRHQSRAASAVRHLDSFRVPALKELAQYTLNGLLSDQPAADITERHAAALVRYVESHALELADPAAVFLLGLVRKSPAAWRRIKAKAERAAAKDKAKAARLAEDAESLAARIKSDSGFAAWLKEEEERAPFGSFPADNWRGKEWRKASPAESLAVAATGLHRITAAAKSLKGHKRAADVLAARLKATRARVRYLKTWESKGAALASFRRYKEGLRGLLPGLKAGTLDKRGAESVRDCVRMIREARPGLLTVKAAAALESIFERAAELHAAAVAAEHAARMEREREARDSWLAGGRALVGRLSDARGGALIRATGVERDDAGRITAGALESSWGASVPLPHALRAFAFVRRVVERGEEWRANGHCIRVGHFRVDHISAQGDMTAGCHRINREEMERLAAALGVSDIRPDDSALESSRGAA